MLFCYIIVSCSHLASVPGCELTPGMLCSAVAKAFKEGCSGYTTEVLKAWEADYENDFGVASPPSLDSNKSGSCVLCSSTVN